MSRKAKVDLYKAKLDGEERDLPELFERSVWKSVDNPREEKAFAKKVAFSNLKKHSGIHETSYLLSVPGMRESLRACLKSHHADHKTSIFCDPLLIYHNVCSATVL